MVLLADPSTLRGKRDRDNSEYVTRKSYYLLSLRRNTENSSFKHWAKTQFQPEL